MRTRVKICGITRPEDAQAAARHGADAIGLVFHAASPRHVTPATAYAIVQTLPAFVTVTGLFVNAEPDAVRGVLEHVPLDLLQFHGDETPADCEQYGRPYIKALPMAHGVDPGRAARQYKHARGLLLDAYHKDVYGGSGEAFDWERIPPNIGKPIILAGGLHPGNVAAAVRRVRPYAVDVSSGVERDKGIKDEVRIREFIEEVTRVEPQ